MEKRHIKQKNRGYITVEASLVVPLFLFFLLAVVKIYMLLIADAHIHQSLAEAAGYVSQYCYLEQQIIREDVKGLEAVVNTAVLISQFGDYLGDDFYVETMVSGGKKGILLTVSKDDDNPKIFYAKADYLIKISVPIIGGFYIKRNCRIKQKAFLGYSREEKSECYVYITPNQSVYHTKRNCTHLELKIRESTSTGKFNPCSFCGKNVEAGEKVYIAENGGVYHCNRNCSGLKRTVTRVRLSEVRGLGPCQRCGK
ncbi:MAG: TadE family protein [Lachnospiraceae bacterium]